MTFPIVFPPRQPYVINNDQPRRHFIIDYIPTLP